MTDRRPRRSGGLTAHHAPSAATNRAPAKSGPKRRKVTTGGGPIWERNQGNPNNPSAGCVHLAKDDAVAWYNDLEVGDEVQVH